MSKKIIGKIRRSQVISTYGPGAIIDFRTPQGAPVSAVSAGLDEWDHWSIRKGMKNEQVISEPRLQQKLGVAGFRLPPVGEERTGGKTNGKSDWRERMLPSIRFPNWHVCPQCNRLRETRAWNDSMGTGGLYCASCSPNARQRTYVVPVRFITTCSHGHLGEFPWHRWVGHKESCAGKKTLKLLSKGAGLKGLHVYCTDCEASRSMDGIFSSKEIARLKCSGKSPWLPLDPEECDQAPRVVQRGASNVYFPVMESALDIPPWGDEFQESLGQHWHNLKSADTDEDLKMTIKYAVLPDWHDPKATVDTLYPKIKHRIEMLGGLNPSDMRPDEYVHLTSGGGVSEKDFEIDPQTVPSSLSQLISAIVRVERLREVRVLTGFTRLTPPAPDTAPEALCRISAERQNWLPAMEVRGEGIFIDLNGSSLHEWEELENVRGRAGQVREAVNRDWQERTGQSEPYPLDISARFLMIHTLSHAFMRRLSLDCGYSSSAIRERLYVSREGEGMCGLLIYTSAPDADGTLGGLSRQGKSKRVEHTLLNAIRDMEWCSSDPLCSKGLSTASDSASLAACHACSFAPETACEQFNRFLDRGLLVGLPEQPDLGFFHSLLKQEN